MYEVWVRFRHWVAVQCQALGVRVAMSYGIPWTMLTERGAKYAEVSEAFSEPIEFVTRDSLDS